MTRTQICLFLHVDVENLDGDGNDAFDNATNEIEGDDGEKQKGVSEVESEEETSQTNSKFLKGIHTLNFEANRCRGKHSC